MSDRSGASSGRGSDAAWHDRAASGRALEWGTGRVVGLPGVGVGAVYLAALIAGEALARLVDPTVGTVFHAIVGVVAVNHAAAAVGAERGVLLALAAIALHRLLVFGAPATTGLPIGSYLAIALAGGAGALVVARRMRYARSDLGVQLTAPALLAGVALLPVGVGLGLALTSLGLVPGPSARMSVPEVAFLVLGVAVLEELLFRGLLQRAASELLGSLGGVTYVALLYAVMAGAPLGLAGVGVVFLIAAGLGALTRLTGSIGPAVLVHGALNASLLVPGLLGS